MKPFLSIIIPVYNGSLYLRETIESVLCQPCNDFELLLMMTEVRMVPLRYANPMRATE